MTGGGLRKRRRPRPSLPTDTVEDTSISFRALGALLWIMARPDGWVIRADHMAKDGKRANGKGAGGRPHRREGREAIRTALLEELAARGYYRLERRRMLDGTFLMGTAASEDPVESWAAQYALFGRQPVPLVQQRDRTFLVQLPDGTLAPDDCEPPPVQEPAEEDHAEEPPGRTGDGFLDTGADVSPDDTGMPVSRNPISVEPAPATPATGEPASGNPSSLLKAVERGVKERSNPPTPRGTGTDDTSADAVPGGDESEKTPTLDEIVIWFRRRTGWNQALIREALVTSVNRGLGSLQEAAAALRELVERPDSHGPTDSPKRLHARPNGEWWAAARATRTRAAAAKLAASPRCQQPGHERQPADRCGQCAGEVKACPSCPRGARSCPHQQAKCPDPVDPEAAARTEAIFAGRQRRGAAESVAS